MLGFLAAPQSVALPMKFSPGFIAVGRDSVEPLRFVCLKMGDLEVAFN